MNCEKVSTLLMDELYGELDEVSRAALRKHCDSCVACGAQLNDLRGTLALIHGQLSVSAPEALEDRIVAAALDQTPFASTKSEPKMGRVISALGRFAMRPQTAMAAVFMLMIGSSALLIKGRRVSPQAPGAGVVVTEQGSPSETAPMGSVALNSGDEEESLQQQLPRERGARAPAAAMAPMPPSPIAMAPQAQAGSAFARSKGAGDEAKKAESVEGETAKESAQRAYRERRFDEAVAQFDVLARGGDTESALWAARSVREKHGCASALTRFDQLASSAFGSPAGYESTLDGGVCYRNQGFLEAASSRFQRLLTVPSHASRAQAELDAVHRIAEARAKEAKERAATAAASAGPAGPGAIGGGGSLAAKAAAPRAVAPAAEAPAKVPATNATNASGGSL
jgi:hypothetical protein